MFEGRPTEDLSRRQQRRQLEDIPDIGEIEADPPLLSVIAPLPIMTGNPPLVTSPPIQRASRPDFRPLSVVQQMAKPTAQRGYINNPSTLSHSRRLSELAGSFPPEVTVVTSTPHSHIRRPGPNIASSVPGPFRQHLHVDRPTAMHAAPIHSQPEVHVSHVEERANSMTSNQHNDHRSEGVV